MTHLPTRDAFDAIDADIVPVFRRLVGDRVTPVSALLALGESEYAFLLESVVGGEKIGRYSFLATSPRIVYEAKDGTSLLHRDGRVEAGQTADPLGDLAGLLGKQRCHTSKDLPSFTGGLVGFAAYDLVRYLEPEKLNHPPVDDRALPDVHFGLYDELVIFDHVDKTVKVVANAFKNRPDAYDDACRRVDQLVDRLRNAPHDANELADINPQVDPPASHLPTLTQAQYEAAVSKGQEYIRAGDIFQFVPSLRLRVESDASPQDVYRALRVINPSPYMFFLRTPEVTLIGSSPEILCRVAGGEVTSRPLAGTRKRGGSEAEDLALEQDLLADPKERAEHVMLVDLHRNDVGRVSQLGSVQVSEPMTVERYSHVMHLTSHVTGRLLPGKTSLDALRVSLPVGTVSGAPKVRAIQIIDELEPVRRGPYGGAVGYIDYAGDMDTCIALRTIVFTRDETSGAGGMYDVQAGAGVVADSVPSSEYAECMNKALALLKAVRAAEETFGQ